MDIYLTNPASRPYTIENNDYLLGRGTSREKRNNNAGVGAEQNRTEQTITIPNKEKLDINILESYYYACTNKVVDRLIPSIGNFLLDSGAFTFMSNSSLAVDWDAYTEEYADYIKSRGIDKFFELDIDSIVGLQEVERLRAKLEGLTGKPPIPVWHLSRGKSYFEKMCERYPYVAIGGIVTQEIKREKYETLFPWFISTAHKYGRKIHGLGYTGKLKKYRFDSVDSTAWLYGNRGGFIYRFNHTKGELEKIDAPNGMKLKSSAAALHNFNEWVKYCQWAKRNL